MKTENWFPLLPGDDGDSIFPSFPNFCGVRTFMGVVLKWPTLHWRGNRRENLCRSPVAQSNQARVQRPCHSLHPCTCILHYPISSSGVFWHKREMQMSVSRCFFLVSDVTYILEAATGREILLAGSPSLWAQAVRELMDCFTLWTWRSSGVKKKAQNFKTMKTLWWLTKHTCTKKQVKLWSFRVQWPPVLGDNWAGIFTYWSSHPNHIFGSSCFQI